MGFPRYVELDYQDVLDVKSARIGNMALGTVGMTPDGRFWKYCKADAIEIGAGLFCTAITTPTNEQTVTVAHPIGIETVTVTAAGIAEDDFKDGYLVVSAGAGAGEIHRIKSNTATVGGVITVTFHQGDGLKVAWVLATTDVDLFKNDCTTLIICPVDGQQLARVLTQGIIPASYYFWGLAKGLGAVMLDVAALASGLELDEKNIVQSLNHAGQAFSDTSPDATKILAGYRQVLGYLVAEQDAVDNEMALANIDLM